MCPLQNVFYQNKYEYQVATAEDFLNFNYQFILKNCIFFTTFHFLMFSELPFLKNIHCTLLLNTNLRTCKNLQLHSCAHICTLVHTVALLCTQLHYSKCTIEPLQNMYAHLKIYS